MDENWFALLEIGLILVGVLAFAGWQLHSLKRDRAITEARLQREREAARNGDVR